MTNEECVLQLEYLKDFKTPQQVEALDLAIKALEQQPCEDCISRQAVKEMLTEEWTKHIPMELDINLSFVLGKINELPSVTPQPKIGRWIDDGWYAEGHSEHAYRCSKCDKNYIGYVGEHKYCPNCGAKMEVEE
jgi:DNA-directed RNA polymerase subunit RPC12/RpoP